MFWHCEQLSVSQPFCIWPVVMLGLAQNLWDLLKLVHFRRTRKQRLESVKLSHNAAKCKNIHRVIVWSASKHVFGSSVPPGGHVFCEGSRVPDFFDEAEVSKFDSCLFLDQHILGLDISVEKAVAMDVI